MSYDDTSTDDDFFNRDEDPANSQEPEQNMLARLNDQAAAQRTANNRAAFDLGNLIQLAQAGRQQEQGAPPQAPPPTQQPTATTTADTRSALLESSNLDGESTDTSTDSDADDEGANTDSTNRPNHDFSYNDFRNRNQRPWAMSETEPEQPSSQPEPADASTRQPQQLTGLQQLFSRVRSGQQPAPQQQPLNTWAQNLPAGSPNAPRLAYSTAQTKVKTLFLDRSEINNEFIRQQMDALFAVTDQLETIIRGSQWEDLDEDKWRTVFTELPIPQNPQQSACVLWTMLLLPYTDTRADNPDELQDQGLMVGNDALTLSLPAVEQTSALDWASQQPQTPAKRLGEHTLNALRQFVSHGDISEEVLFRDITAVLDDQTKTVKQIPHDREYLAAVFASEVKDAILNAALTFAPARLAWALGSIWTPAYGESLGQSLDKISEFTQHLYGAQAVVYWTIKAWPKVFTPTEKAAAKINALSPGGWLDEVLEALESQLQIQAEKVGYDEEDGSENYQLYEKALEAIIKALTKLDNNTDGFNSQSSNPATSHLFAFASTTATKAQYTADQADADAYNTWYYVHTNIADIERLKERLKEDAARDPSDTEISDLVEAHEECVARLSMFRSQKPVGRVQQWENPDLRFSNSKLLSKWINPSSIGITRPNLGFTPVRINELSGALRIWAATRRDNAKKQRARAERRQDDLDSRNRQSEEQRQQEQETQREKAALLNKIAYLESKNANLERQLAQTQQSGPGQDLWTTGVAHWMAFCAAEFQPQALIEETDLSADRINELNQSFVRFGVDLARAFRRSAQLWCWFAGSWSVFGKIGSVHPVFAVRFENADFAPDSEETIEKLRAAQKHLRDIVQSIAGDLDEDGSGYSSLLVEDTKTNRMCMALWSEFRRHDVFRQAVQADTLQLLQTDPADPNSPTTDDEKFAVIAELLASESDPVHTPYLGIPVKYTDPDNDPHHPLNDTIYSVDESYNNYKRIRADFFGGIDFDALYDTKFSTHPPDEYIRVHAHPRTTADLSPYTITLKLPNTDDDVNSIAEEFAAAFRGTVKRMAEAQEKDEWEAIAEWNV